MPKLRSLTLDTRLAKFIGQISLLLDVKNTESSPVIFHLTDSSLNTMVIYCSSQEPTMTNILPANVLWLDTNPVSENYNKIQRRMSKNPPSGASSGYTWTMVQTIEELSVAQFYDDEDAVILSNKRKIHGATDKIAGSAKLSHFVEDSIAVGEGDVRLTNSRVPLAHRHETSFANILGTTHSVTIEPIDVLVPGMVLCATSSTTAQWRSLESKDVWPDKIRKFRIEGPTTIKNIPDTGTSYRVVTSIVYPTDEDIVTEFEADIVATSDDAQIVFHDNSLFRVTPKNISNPSCIVRLTATILYREQNSDIVIEYKPTLNVSYVDSFDYPIALSIANTSSSTMFWFTDNRIFTLPVCFLCKSGNVENNGNYLHSVTAKIDTDNISVSVSTDGINVDATQAVLGRYLLTLTYTHELYHCSVDYYIEFTDRSSDLQVAQIVGPHWINVESNVPYKATISTPSVSRSAILTDLRLVVGGSLDFTIDYNILTVRRFTNHFTTGVLTGFADNVPVSMQVVIVNTPKLEDLVIIESEPHSIVAIGQYRQQSLPIFACNWRIVCFLLQIDEVLQPNEHFVSSSIEGVLSASTDNYGLVVHAPVPCSVTACYDGVNSNTLTVE